MNEVFYYKSEIGIFEIDIRDDHLYGINVSDNKESLPNTKLGKEVKKQLDLYFDGKLKVFDIPITLSGTPFQKEVYKELVKVKYNEIISYEDLAIRVKNKNYSRAVGSALNKNNISIVVPCHRVIGKNNKLVGFASGIDKKEFLINLEKNND